MRASATLAGWLLLVSPLSAETARYYGCYVHALTDLKTGEVSDPPGGFTFWAEEVGPGHIDAIIGDPCVGYAGTVLNSEMRLSCQGESLSPLPRREVSGTLNLNLLTGEVVHRTFVGSRGTEMRGTCSRVEPPTPNAES